MKLRRLPKALASFTVLLSPLFAFSQTTVPQFTDPANLRGERVKPRDGRELPIDQGARGLEQMLRKLNTRASLMLIVAHPDDEDGGMLTYYSRGLGARVAVLTLTRGEGGQNAMTGDFEDALGLLRTQELLSADRYLGVDQFFGTEVDFGFSKTKEEAFKKWTHERVLYDAVRSIRLYRPLVIAAVFIGGVTDGHGQHQVSGQIAQEAFKAAADPTVFPDMIAEGILPWQALKVYARVPSYSISDRGLFDYATGKYTAARFENYVTGEITTTTPSSDVVVHEGTVDPILSDNPSDPPRTYVQFARIGLGMQKSQIGGNVRVPPAGAFDVAYHLYGSALPHDQHPPSGGRHPKRSEGSATPPALARPLEPFSHAESANFFDGIETSILSLQEYRTLPTDIARKLAATIDSAAKQFDSAHPEAIAPTLVDALKTCDELIRLTGQSNADPLDKANALHELRIKRVQLNDALVLAFNVTFAAYSPSNSYVTAHNVISLKAEITAHSGDPCLLQKTWLQNSEGVRRDVTNSKAGSKSASLTKRLTWPMLVANEKNPFRTDFTGIVTRPYFERKSLEQPAYDLLDAALRNASQSPMAFSAHAMVECGQTEIEVAVIPHSADEGNQPLQIVPNLDISLSTHAHVLPLGTPSFKITATDNSFASRAYLTDLCLPTGCVTKDRAQIKGTNSFIYEVTPPQAVLAQEFDIRAEGFSADQVPSTVTRVEGYRPIGYGDLPRTNYYTPATVRIVPVDLNLPHARIAYLPGTGDAVPEALVSINLKPKILTLADLTLAKLVQYDTVILGVRTYAAHHDLHGAPTKALLDYARSGGNVLVQYQTTEFTGEDAPFPLSLGSNEKVVDEDAPVQLSDPKAPFLSTPNKITPADFNDWVEERGHGFLSTWDAQYTAPTETHDADQAPQRGGLITTPLGKGRWTYCAFALYRQLPEAVPGAFRIFVNLLSPINLPPTK